MSITGNYIIENRLLKKSYSWGVKSNLERITIVMEFYHSRGTNKESVNELYRKIINS